MLFIPKSDFLVSLSEGIVALRQGVDGTLWSRIPYANWSRNPVELLLHTWLMEVVGLTDTTTVETVGALVSGGENGLGREDELLEQVDEMFPSREHNTLSVLVRDLGGTFSLGNERLIISRLYFHEDITSHPYPPVANGHVKSGKLKTVSSDRAVLNLLKASTASWFQSKAVLLSFVILPLVSSKGPAILENPLIYFL